MPVLFCQSCCRDTQHKAVLRKRAEDDVSLKNKFQKFNELMNQLFSGVHYHKMDRVCLCRDCNHQTAVFSQESAH
ncbi:hypothetical protein [Vibrio gangliei]|uniref:hypothetical protein n=1 Tax=Vibrio gangliei TaxID=2077090 RepID=UPI000D01FE41|nr:hypothetical protein [Vibrio gangliei]